MTTAQNITDTQISSLSDEAVEAGDYDQAMLCWVALGSDPTGADCIDIWPLDLDPDDYSQDEARSMCADVVRYAEQLADDCGPADDYDRPDAVGCLPRARGLWA